MKEKLDIIEEKEEIIDSEEEQQEDLVPVVFTDPEELKKLQEKYQADFLAEKIRAQEEHKKYTFDTLPSEISSKIRHLAFICILALISVIFLSQNWIISIAVGLLLILYIFVYSKIIIATLNSRNYHTHRVLINSVENNVVRKMISIYADYIFNATEFLENSTKEVTLTSKNKTDYIPGRFYKVYFSNAGTYLFKEDITHEFNI